MSIYTFMFMDAAGVSAMLEFDDCADEQSARRHALDLLASAPHRGGVEFWAEGGQPMQVTAADLAVSG
ncbi:hypothetical protein [Brevundimonas sp.]|uniref:hypothetical protein n=1 Tax=Brevundimonas sp. TaxID=1871086 RepID=UPI00391DF272